MSLQNAVIRTVGGKSYLKDVYNHGADAGYPGFTYYHDTCRFYARHKAEINSLAEEMAESLGEDVIEMVKNFNCIKGDFSTSEIAKTMYGRRTEKEKNDLCQIDNALAWFALEEIARSVFDN
jgi:hypothetical protein